MKNETHLVIDLETLSTEKNAVVLSIGYAIVKNAKIVTYCEHRLSMSEQSHRHINQATIKWWLDGEKCDAQKHMNSLKEVTLCTAMDELNKNLFQYTTWEKVLVWGNSPSFDCVILDDLLRDVGKYKSSPWMIYNERDMRTMRAMFPHERNNPRIPHSAMWDSVAEAEDLIKYLDSL